MKNEPAFPSYQIEDIKCAGWVAPAKMINGGLTKREYFAAMAMQGLANHVYSNGNFRPATEMAKRAIETVDALLKELEGE